MDNYIAFTTVCNGIANKLTNEVILINGEKAIQARALWDTGATNSCVSHDVASALDLVPIGMINNYGTTGSSWQNAYIIDVCLPNDLKVENVRVTESEIGNQGIDILIGMDIIGLGDMAISNYGGRTVFSFRFPSVETTSFVKINGI